ncbi:hypothetical protein [Paenibacillus bovis]|uniref:Uncharacterized protein n=1 Tax=Paenibacillus bovis TaxID=1616788 RepID=A0A1X9T4A0_9BACL|nr:hypothetical protein [Paenibacillus bovis]ARR10753.1 hypothetical protein AR543_p0145 [Paenibacillus bovis]
MNTELQQHVASIRSAPLQALSFILLQTKFKWCKVGWVSWALRQTPAAQPLLKLQAAALPKAEREVDYWPTPMASGHQIVAPRRGKGQIVTLSQQLAIYEPDHIGEVINPAWIECMMGFPEGWTSLDPRLCIQE